MKTYEPTARHLRNATNWGTQERELKYYERIFANNLSDPTVSKLLNSIRDLLTVVKNTIYVDRTEEDHSRTSLVLKQIKDLTDELEKVHFQHIEAAEAARQ